MPRLLGNTSFGNITDISGPGIFSDPANLLLRRIRIAAGRIQIDIHLGGNINSGGMPDILQNKCYAHPSCGLIQVQIGKDLRGYLYPRSIRLSGRCSLVSDSAKLIVHRVRLPFRLCSQLGQIAYRVLDVGSVGGIAIGHVGNDQRAETYEEGQPFIDGKAARKTGDGRWPPLRPSWELLDAPVSWGLNAEGTSTSPLCSAFVMEFLGFICLLAAWLVYQFAAPMVGSLAQ